MVPSFVDKKNTFGYGALLADIKKKVIENGIRYVTGQVAMKSSGFDKNTDILCIDAVFDILYISMFLHDFRYFDISMKQFKVDC